MKLVTTALEWSYLAGETEVKSERLKSAAELLVLRHDTLKFIDGTGPEALPQDQNKAEPASVNGKEPEQQTVPENAQQNAKKTVETAKEQEHMSKTANCTFSGKLVPIDLKRFADSGINLVECPDCGRTRSLSPSKGILRFKPHIRAPPAGSSDRETLVSHRNNRLERDWRIKEKRQAEI